MYQYKAVVKRVIDGDTMERRSQDDLLIEPRLRRDICHKPSGMFQKNPTLHKCKYQYSSTGIRC